MNKVILMGRLTKAPEMKYSQGATPLAVCRYTLAVNRRFQKDGEQGADFINCVAFGKAGEFAAKYFKKGQMVGVVGRLQVNSWKDREDKMHWNTDVVIEEQHFAGGKRKMDRLRQGKLRRVRRRIMASILCRMGRRMRIYRFDNTERSGADAIKSV